MKKYKAIDLFAGAGGLSLGFMQTGRFDIKVAYENNPSMQETYKLNHLGVDVRGDVCKADYSEIKKAYGNIDVVIGGPPCQGFSNANRQKNTAISQNNMLVKQYIRAIIELQPSAFVMENVSMLKSDVHRFFLNQEDKSVVDKYHIKTKKTLIDLIGKDEFFSEAVDIVKDKKRIIDNLWPEDHYKALNVIYKITKNEEKLRKALDKHKSEMSKCIDIYVNKTINNHIDKVNKQAFASLQNYYNGVCDIKDIYNNIKDSIEIQRMLRKSKELLENEIIIYDYSIKDGLKAQVKSYAVYDYLKAVLGSEENGYVIDDRILCAADYGAPQKRMRFVVMGIKKSITDEVVFPATRYSPNDYRTVYDAISDLSTVTPFYDLKDDKQGIKLKKKYKKTDLNVELRNADVLKNHIITKTTDVAMQRFKAIKSGQNFHSLSEELKTNTYTDSSRTQNTIYLRLNYDEPCGTVVNVRKSMWIHPELDRAISVREAARLQTFPDDFVFCGTKDKQYQQVGNAVPPMLANAIALSLTDMLDKKYND